MTWRSRGRSSHEFFVVSAITDSRFSFHFRLNSPLQLTSKNRIWVLILQYVTFGGFLAGFIFYLCVGNYQRAKKAMERQRRRRLELEEEKRALVYSPSASIRRRNFAASGEADSPRSGFSGSSSMYTDDKGLMMGVGGVEVGNQSHMLLGGDSIGDRRLEAATHKINAPPPPPPRDLLDDYEGQTRRNFSSNASQGEMSV